VNFKIYKGVYHCFDCAGIETGRHGYRSSYSIKATEKAELETKMFSEKYLD
jgi:dienelactone hydrolase